MENCKNCRAEFTGTYCPECGQKQNSGRIVFRDIAKDVLVNLFGFDAPIFRTLWELIRNPGQLVRNYIFGRRKRYTHPFRLFILTLAVYLVLKAVIGFDPVQIFSEAIGAREMPNPNTPDTIASDFFSEHVNSFLLIFAFTLALFSRLFFRKSGFHFVEYLTLSFYTIAEYLFFLLFIIVGSVAISSKVFLINYIIVIFYPVYVLTSFHSGNFLWRILKSIFVILLAWPLYVIVSFMLAQFIVNAFIL